MGFSPRAFAAFAAVSSWPTLDIEGSERSGLGGGCRVGLGDSFWPAWEGGREGRVAGLGRRKRTPGKHESEGGDWTRTYPGAIETLWGGSIATRRMRGIHEAEG